MLEIKHLRTVQGCQKSCMKYKQIHNRLTKCKTKEHYI